MSGSYDVDGTMNITVVDGSARTGLIADDGSINVVQVDGNDIVGAYHPCGAWNVFKYDTGQPSAKHKSGALMVSESPFTEGTTKVNVVSGSLT